MYDAVSNRAETVISPLPLPTTPIALAGALAIIGRPNTDVQLWSVFTRRLRHHAPVAAPVVDGTVVGMGESGRWMASAASASFLGRYR